MTDDELFMQEALAEAQRAEAEDEVPIGAVVVRDGQIIARAHNAVERLQQSTAHAELLAVNQAEEVLQGWRLDECTLYVTKEPCPMCAGALVNAKLRRLVFGCPDAKYGAAGGAINLCDLPGALWKIPVTSGILAQESLTLLRNFFHRKRKNENMP